MTDDQQNYTPSDEEVREEYVYGAQEVDMDGHVVVSFDESCARWDRFLAQVKRDAARAALDGLAAESRELAREMEPHDQGANAYTARAARLYRDTHYPEDVTP